MVQLSLDSNGTHVIQSIVKYFREERLCGLLQELTVSDKNLLQVSSSCHGICVIKALIDKTKCKHPLFKQFQRALCRLSYELAQDPFGNYALQTMIGAWSDTVEFLIASDGPLLPKKLVELSLQKFSSNVVDKLIQNAGMS